MSWLWSSDPPPNGAAAAAAAHADDDDDDDADAHRHSAYAQLHSDPYATPLSAADAFADAFDDTSSPHPLHMSASPFDLTLPSDHPAAAAATATTTNPAPFDFSRVSRIDPAILNARASPRTSAPAGPAVAAEYVFAEDYAPTRKKSWGEQLTYLAGCSYLGGASLGGLYGLRAALLESSGRPFRLRLNAVLNAMGKRGALLANSAGVLALAFSLTESALYSYRSEDDVLNYAVAGGAAGAMFRSTAGVRPAAASGLAAALVAVGAVYSSRRGWYGHRMQGML
ncbi:unnamed protein product [Agarophyton chilense]|eukprot:gb/GEZJ01003538.1/.p3 GENE.gb/GEZJ01003538.1/~~gb/GEZJ01003538.1/.p3  ORF type:complete len:313 (-),score=65.82 gb/GEZJ01003538.1/:1537-2385(-)